MKGGSRTCIVNFRSPAENVSKLINEGISFIDMRTDIERIEETMQRLIEKKNNLIFSSSLLTDLDLEGFKTKIRKEVIEEEKKALLKEIEASQGDLGQYHARQAKCAEEKAQLETALPLPLSLLSERAGPTFLHPVSGSSLVKLLSTTEFLFNKETLFKIESESRNRKFVFFKKLIINVKDKKHY